MHTTTWTRRGKPDSLLPNGSSVCNDSSVAYIFKHRVADEVLRGFLAGFIWVYRSAISRRTDPDRARGHSWVNDNGTRMAYAYDAPSTGVNLLWLLNNSPEWVHRRVDSLRLDADGTTRRFVSLDLTVPQAMKCQGSAGRVMVPMGVLEKGTKQKFDATYEGKSIPVLGRKDNSLVVAQILRASQPLVFSERTNNDEDPTALFISITSCDPSDSESVWERYIDWSESVVGDLDLTPSQQSELEAFDVLVDQMTKNFVLLAEVDEYVLGRRVVMKYAFDQDEPTNSYPGTSSAVIAQDVPDLGFAASHHVELEVPSGLFVQKLELIELRGEGDDQQDLIARKRSSGRVAHVNINPSSPDAMGVLRAEIGVVKQGVFSFTIVTVWALLVAVLGATAVRMFNENVIRGEPEIPSPAASILLIGPALLVSWMSRSPEHPMVSGMLKPLRRMLILSAFSLLVMAGLAAVKVQPWLWQSAWVVILVLTILNLLLLLFFQYNIRVTRSQKFGYGVRYRNDEDAEER